MTGSPAPPASLRRIRWALAGLLLAVLAPATVAAPVQAATPVATHIVQLAPGVSNAAGAQLVRAAGGRVTGSLPIIHGLAVRLPASGVVTVGHDARVKALTANSRVAPQASQIDATSLASAYPASVKATKAWGSATGRGVGVAVIDTGIAGGLPDFKGDDGRSRVIASAVVNPDATTAADTYGHGTHVAGILAGDGNRRSDSLQGRYIGIAPEADLISIKAADDAGRATVLDIIYGLQFAVDHQAEYNIRVVNLSLQSTTAESYTTDPLDAAVESAYFHGIVVVAAAGNRGSASDAVSYAPGNDPFAITVGAVDDQGTKGAGDDLVTSWSSTGRTQDGVMKPDVAAPGARIVSTLAPNSVYSTLCPACIVGGRYLRAGGTSMAAPVVAGTAALILQRHPDWTPDQVKSTILATTRKLNSRDVREVNAAAAVSATEPASGADAGIAPNRLVDPATGDIDYSLSSWSLSSWSQASDPLTADWALSSWSCTCSATASGSVTPSLSSWSLSSWSTRWDL
ncbi:MAG: serine protease AprX [Solirubrobacteraceae bacterium]|nr:serine protease AprX [Solirubrobacteraceae bacterium]